MTTKNRYDRRDIRRLNAMSVLDQLRNQGPLSRAQIAQHLGLTRAAVSNIVSELLETSLICETDFVAGSAGRPGLLLSLNAECACIIAVRIDLDSVTVALANLGQEIIWRKDASLDPEATPTECLQRAETLIDEGLSVGHKAGLACFGISVAWSGLVDHEAGKLAYGPISGWEDISLRENWEERFSAPVFVENEAHASAIGVRHHESTRGADNLVYLSLGVGLAAGVFVGGSLLRGDQGFAGQIGHIAFTDNGKQCSCGKRGCWVTEIGSLAIIEKLKAAGVRLPDQQHVQEDWIGYVTELAESGDAKVASVLNAVGEQVGKGLAGLVQTFNPSLVVVGGRLRSLMKYADTSIRSTLMDETLPHMKETLEFKISDSDDDNLAGCFATVFEVFMKNPPLKS
ncbi:ROK family transcriptional regulator [Rubellicoccus peritrichatus]|uniref:ROK family transcriptional regulator n=1 Tax=Rubellicoccus peritrichatus TaxID=3080537 RepID=A0AAQ3L8N9_9BACT|nr:ROK family transcriptional regulator [Puniceicoccus sp. CR14]WOO39969.1 ROK family transcriptional regulator [Puniceicoccus sp. CR14]